MLYTSPVREDSWLEAIISSHFPFTCKQVRFFHKEHKHFQLPLLICFSHIRTAVLLLPWKLLVRQWTMLLSPK